MKNSQILEEIMDIQVHEAFLLQAGVNKERKKWVCDEQGA